MRTFLQSFKIYKRYSKETHTRRVYAVEEIVKRHIMLLYKITLSIKVYEFTKKNTNTHTHEMSFTDKVRTFIHA